MKRPRFVLVCGLLLLEVWCAATFSLLAREPGSHPKDKSTQAEQSYMPPSDPALHAGTETCKTCHEDKSKGYAENRHYVTTQARHGPEWEGSEGCRGPGKAHAANAAWHVTHPGTSKRTFCGRRTGRMM